MTIVVTGGISSRGPFRHDSEEYIECREVMHRILVRRNHLSRQMKVQVRHEVEERVASSVSC